MNRFLLLAHPSMHLPSNPRQAAHPAMRRLRRAQAAIAALATGPCGMEAVTIVQAIGRVLAVHPGGAADAPRPPDAPMPIGVGQVLSPTQTALLASMGASTLRVFARTRIGVVCLSGAGRDCRTGEAMLSGLVSHLGAKALSTRCAAPDLRSTLPHTVEMLLAGCDLVLLCGPLDGADWNELVASSGARTVDTSTFGLPGLRPLRIARQAGKLLVQFGEDLGSAFANFVLLLSPLVRRLQGREDPIPPAIHFAVGDDFAASGTESLVLTRAGHVAGLDPFPLSGAAPTDALLRALARASGLAWCAPADAGDTPRLASYFPLDAWLS